jgi:hypothetical protein
MSERSNDIASEQLELQDEIDAAEGYDEWAIFSAPADDEEDAA